MKIKITISEKEHVAITWLPNDKEPLNYPNFLFSSVLEANNLVPSLSREYSQRTETAPEEITEIEIDDLANKNYELISTFISNIPTTGVKPKIKILSFSNDYLDFFGETPTQLEIIQIDTKTLLNTYLFNTEHEFNKYYYRGESTTYKTTLTTTAKRLGLTSDKASELLSAYRKKGLLFKSVKLESNDKETLSSAHAQHHGLPTEMLDWTEKVGIALFFSIDGKRDDQPSVVYQMNKKALPEYEIGISDEEKEELYKGWFVYAPDFIDERIEAQQGLFTHQGKSTVSLLYSAEIIFDFLENKNKIKKYLISKHLHHDILNILDSMNINEYTMYKDYNSLARLLKREGGINE